MTQNSALSQDWIKCIVCTHPWPKLCARYRGAAPLGHDTSLYRNKLLVARRVLRRIARLPGSVAALARPCRAPLLVRPGLGCLLSLMCACSACCMPVVCHNTVEPAMCLLSLLHATIQLSLPCACSAYYVPQYSLLYCDSIFFLENGQ